MKAKLYRNYMNVDNVNSYLEQDEECKFRVGEGYKASPDIKSIISTAIMLLFIITIFAVVMSTQGRGVLMHGEGARPVMNGLIPIVGMMGLMALYMLGSLIAYIVTLVKLKKCDYPVQATIIMLEDHIHRNRRGPTIHDIYPVFHYYYNGKHYIARSDDVSYRMHYMNCSTYLGQDVRVLINPDNPYSCKMEDDSAVNSARLFTYIFTVVIFFIMMYIMCSKFLGLL